MIYKFLNDTSNIMTIHPTSNTLQTSLEPGECIDININDDESPFIKVWDKCVLLSCIVPVRKK